MISWICGVCGHDKLKARFRCLEPRTGSIWNSYLRHLLNGIGWKMGKRGWIMGLYQIKRSFSMAKQTTEWWENLENGRKCAWTTYPIKRACEIAHYINTSNPKHLSLDTHLISIWFLSIQSLLKLSLFSVFVILAIYIILLIYTLFSR